MHRRAALLFAVAMIAASAAEMRAADPTGFSGRGALALDATTTKGQLSLQGAAAFERRDSHIRVDLVSLSLMDRASGMQMPSPLPSGGYSFVYDTSTMVYTVWCPARRTYYTGRGRPSTRATPASSPTPTPAPTGTAEQNDIGSLLKSLKDLRQFSISLTLAPDKTPIDGHPTTNFDFHFARAVKAEDPIDVDGRATFADDLGGIPILLVAKASNGTAATMSANLRAALSGVVTKAPPATDFVIPSGYKKVASLLDVIVLPSLAP